METVGNARGVKDSVGQKVKAGDAMLRGFFFEQMPWSTMANTRYYLCSGDASMDVRHVVRGAGKLGATLKGKRLTRAQRRSVPDSSDGKEYRVTDAQHESIMELIAPMSVDDNGALAV